MQPNSTPGPAAKPAGTAHHNTHTRVPRWSLTMAYWSLMSAMFWLYIAQASNHAFGTVNTIIGWVLSVATYGALNAVFARRAIRTGETVSIFSGRIFGAAGSTLSTLLFGVTAIYFAVFEGSIISSALQQSLGGDIRIWYAVVAICSIPLVAGGVQNWLDRLNGWLLPFYFIGMAAVIVATNMKVGYPTDWLSKAAPEGLALPGWMMSYLLYMGVWLMMVYTFDFARHGRQEDAKFHAHVTVGWVFYIVTFIANGLCGIYIVTAWGLDGTEVGIVTGMLNALGIFGLIHILVSQARIQSANYFAASNSLRSFYEDVTGKKTHRITFVIVSVVGSYLFMLTDVISYLVRALAWQGAFVTTWVFMALLWLIFSHHRHNMALEVKRGWKAFGVPGLAWVLSSTAGILLAEQTFWPQGAALSPVISITIATVLYVPWLLKNRGSSETHEIALEEKVTPRN